MLALVWAMTAVLATWIALGLVQMGLGLAAQRLAGVRHVDADRCVLAFWTGYAVLIGLLQLWHLALPVTALTLVIVCGLGAAGLLWCSQDLGRWLGAVLGPRRAVAGVIVLAGLWIANQAIGPGDAHDSGLYHYQVIRWINEHPVVPGLVNLATPYAINTGNLLQVAMVNTGPWHGRGEHVANGLLLWGFLAQVIVAMARLRQGRGDLARSVYGAVLVVPAVMLLFSKEVSSPKTDLAGNVVLYVIGWRLLALLEPAERPARERLYDAVAVAGLCALAPCLKLSTAFFAASAWALAMVVWVARHRREAAYRDWGFIWSVVISVALVGPWVARNVVTSGYPLYPSAVAGLPVEWRLNRRTVEAYGFRLRIQTQGRLTLWIAENLEDSPFAWYGRLMKPPYEHWEDIKGHEWLVPWFIGLPASSLVEVVMPLGLTVAAWGVLLVRRRRRPPGPAAWLMVPCLIAWVFWFPLMPGPRYAYGFAWVTAALSVALAVRSITPVPGRRGAVVVIAGCLLLTLPAIAYRFAMVSVLREGSPLAQIPFRGPGPDHGFHPHPEAQVVRTWQTKRGVRVHVPGERAKCWDCPLPCLGWPPDPFLQLRREGDLSSGFIVNRWGVFDAPPGPSPRDGP